MLLTSAILILVISLFYNNCFANGNNITGFGKYRFGMSVSEVNDIANANGDYLDPNYTCKTNPNLRTYTLCLTKPEVLNKI